MMNATRSDDCKSSDQPVVMQELTEKLDAIAFIEEENRMHPSLQLASTALRKGLTSAELTDVVPPSPSTPTSLSSASTESNRTESNANIILLKPVDLKCIEENTLSPREQERADEAVLRGLRHLFNNRFMSAKTLFEQRADSDPLYALALSCMAFLKAVMTSAENDQNMALDALNTTYGIAKAQLEAAKRTSKISDYFSGYYNYIRGSRGGGNTPPASPSHLPTTPPATPKQQFPSNGVLRAHVIKAECCLLTSVIQLLQESVMSYVKCGLNLRRAYVSYNFVWQQYKAMGDNYAAFMDSDTVSGVQFGIGSVHLVLSALPAKILKAISVLGWKPDKELGFTLLKTCAEDKRIRAPMATVMLMAYYTAATSFAPQILSEKYTKVAMETLLEAQRYYPNSALYLYFAGRISRHALDLSLSTQSFLYATDMTKKDWAEVPVANACSYETALNHMITGNWEQAASSFETLHKQKYWSQAFCKYMEGACLEMVPGKRSEAILAFAQVPSLVVKKLGGRMADMDAYALHKVQALQATGYQELDYYTPALEFVCIWNLFPYMDARVLEQCHRVVVRAIECIQTQENREYEIRSQELAPENPPPDHFDQRAVLLLVKASIQNAAGQAGAENTILLNWIVDHKDCFASDTWVVPYALWEAGVAAWHVNNGNRSRYLWEMALSFSKYDFEYRLAVRLNLALSHAEESGYTEPIPQPVDDKKRLYIKGTAAKVENGKPDRQDKTGPKHSPSPYMFFSQEVRSKVKEENPDASFGQLGKILVEKWEDMSDQEKAPYVKKAEDYKKHYEAEKTASEKSA